MKPRPSKVASHIRLLRDAAELHQAEIDKDTHFYRVSDLAARWGCSATTVTSIPVEELPYLNVGHGLRNTARRYKPDEVERYEARRTARFA